MTSGYDVIPADDVVSLEVVCLELSDVDRWLVEKAYTGVSLPAGVTLQVLLDRVDGLGLVGVVLVPVLCVLCCGSGVIWRG